MALIHGTTSLEDMQSLTGFSKVAFLPETFCCCSSSSCPDSICLKTYQGPHFRVSPVFCLDGDTKAILIERKLEDHILSSEEAFLLPVPIGSNGEVCDHRVYGLVREFVYHTPQILAAMPDIDRVPLADIWEQINSMKAEGFFLTDVGEVEVSPLSCLVKDQVANIVMDTDSDRVYYVWSLHSGGHACQCAECVPTN